MLWFRWRLSQLSSDEVRNNWPNSPTIYTRQSAVFDLWSEAGVPAENSPYRHLERQQVGIHTEKPQVFFKLSCIINDI